MKSGLFHVQDEPLVKKLLMIDGFTRAGKFFLGKIVAGIRNTDHFQSVSSLEQIPFIHRLGGMSDDAAVALFRKILDEHAYNIRIGRNLNTRISDASSIYHSPEFGEYIRRSSSEFGSINLDSDKVIESFWKGGRWSVFLTHETLPNAGLLFKAYPGLRMLNLIRHPVDVTHSWYARGWGRRFGNDPLSFTAAVRGPTEAIPWHAHAYGTEYENMSEADRVIRGIVTLTGLSAAAWSSLDSAQRDQIRFVRYEDVVERPHPEIARMAAFLETEPGEGMAVILSRERCPGKVSLEKRRQKLEELKANAGEEAFALLCKAAAEYESRENPYHASEAGP